MFAWHPVNATISGHYTSPRRLRFARVGAASVWLLGIAACGGGESPAKSVVAGVEEGAAPRRVVIRMLDDMTFDPAAPVVSVGDTVVWINAGAMPHTSTNRPGVAGVPEHNILPEGAEPWDSGLLDPQAEMMLIVSATGEYTYLCALHEAMGMVGKFSAR